MQRFAIFSLSEPNFLVKSLFSMLNATFAMTVFDSMSRVYGASLVIMLPKQLKLSKFSSCS